MSDELASELKKHVDSLGEDYDPNGPLFPNMNFENMEFEMVNAMEQIGVDPAIVYAFQETGFMISEENLNMFSQKDLDLWRSKIDEYHSLNGHAPETYKFPMGTIAMYGPDDKKVTKIVAGVILHEDAEPILERFMGSAVETDPKVQKSIAELFGKYDVRSVLSPQGNIGCPHEEGEDFPIGGDCPFCPFWKGKQGSGAEPF